jgi:hypothetical protein
MMFVPTQARRMLDPARLHNYEDGAELASIRSRRSSTSRRIGGLSAARETGDDVILEAAKWGDAES